MDEHPPPLILCMENINGQEVALRIDPTDDFRKFLEKATSLLGYEVDMNSVTRNQPVSLTDNAYQFLLTSEHLNTDIELGTQTLEQICEPTDGANDLVYILDDGTQINASQIQFDNEDEILDLTLEKIPFVKYAHDIYDDGNTENVAEENTRKYNIIESPVSKWNQSLSPKGSFINNVPFKLVCNNTSGFEAQFTKYLENSATPKTYTTLNPVTVKNKSPTSLVKENYKTFEPPPIPYQAARIIGDNANAFSREDVLNMFKDSPVPTTPFENLSEKRKHARKSDPLKPVHKKYYDNIRSIPYIDVDGTLIGQNESQNCFICAKFVDNNREKMYIFDNEDQRIHRESALKKQVTQLKVICDECLASHFKPINARSPNQSLNPDEYLVIRNNQQYIFQKVTAFNLKNLPSGNFVKLGEATAIIDKIESQILKAGQEKEFVKVEIGSDGQIIDATVDKKDNDEIVKDEKDGSSSDVEIIEPGEPEIDDNVIDNLEDADEHVKEFLGKYQIFENTELKCRFCEKKFNDLSEAADHGTEHKHNLEDGDLYPCPMCDYGYAKLKWLKAHLKAAHEKTVKSDEKNDTQNDEAENKSVIENDKTEKSDTNIDEKEFKKDFNEVPISVEANKNGTEKSEEKDKVNETIKEEIKKEEKTDVKEQERPSPTSSPVAKRTRSSSRKSANPQKATREKIEPPKEPKVEPTKTESNVVNSVTEDGTVLIKTEVEVKTETVDSDGEEAIWIVQTAEDESDLDEQQVRDLLRRAKENDQNKGGAKSQKHQCLNCCELFISEKILALHTCTKKRGRKRKTVPASVSTEQDYVKKGQGRKVTLNKPPKKIKSTSDPQILTCDNCNKTFTSKVRLKFHMQFHDSNKTDAPDQYTCSFRACERVFLLESELFDHVHFDHKQRRWQCRSSGCEKTFYLRANLTKHSRIHTDTRRYICTTCGKRFLDKQTLDEHGVTHLQIKPYQCHICMKQLTRRSRLRMHLRAHEELSPRPVLVCAVCCRAFPDHCQAEEHATSSESCMEKLTADLKKEDEELQLSPTSGHVKMSDQMDEPAVKSLSKRQIRYQLESSAAEPMLCQLRDEVRPLIRVVLIEKAFRCEYCEDVFYIEEGLNAHRGIHKGVKNPFTCHICKVSFTTYSRCTTHKTTHGYYKKPVISSSTEGTVTLGQYGGFPVAKHFLCEDCGRSYLHWTYLQVHRRMKHASENFVYECGICNTTFPNSWSIAYHKKKMHSGTEGQGDSAKVNKVPKDNYRIPCRDCDEVLPNKTALYKHRRDNHSDASILDGDKPGVWFETACDICGEKLDSFDALKDHRRNVHGEQSDYNQKPKHACPICEHTFRTASMRNEHVRTHSGEKPFPCDLCGKTFRRSSAMRNHRLIHTEQRVWGCARCDKRFRARSHLRAHHKARHNHTTLVIEVPGLNPTPEEVVSILQQNNISPDKVLDIGKLTFPKGTSSIIPSSERALTLLSGFQRPQPPAQTHTAPCTPPAPPHTATAVDNQMMAPRGHMTHWPKILDRSGNAPRNIDTLRAPDLSTSNMNLQMMLRDKGIIVNDQQVAQMQMNDNLLLN